MEELEEISKPTKERQIHFKISSSLEMYNPVPIMSDNLNKKVKCAIIQEFSLRPHYLNFLSIFYKKKR